MSLKTVIFGTKILKNCPNKLVKVSKNFHNNQFRASYDHHDKIVEQGQYMVSSSARNWDSKHPDLDSNEGRQIVN